MSRVETETERVPDYKQPQRSRSVALPKPKDVKFTEQLKQKYIEEIEGHNRRLKGQISRINDILANQNQKTPKSKQQHKLVPVESNEAAIRRQLENVYKQIKSYEREVKSLEEKGEAGGQMADKLIRLDNIVKEKDMLLAKLKAELHSITKQTDGMARKLTGIQPHEQLDDEMPRYQQQLLALKERVREAEQKEKKKQENAKKQFDYIRRIEKELVDSGISEEQLEELKKKNIFELLADRSQEQLERKPRGSLQPLQDQQVSAVRIQEIKKEIAVKMKLQREYEKKIDKLTNDCEGEERRLLEARVLLFEKDNDIESLQQEIKLLKKNIKKSNLKPHLVPQVEPQAKKRQKYQLTINKQASTTHGHLKYDEKGLPTEKGSKFTDRSIMGSNFNCKIIGVKVWTDKRNFSLAGLQCIYRMGRIRKLGGQHLKGPKTLLTENVMELDDGDYIKSVSGALNNDNTIEYLIFMSQREKVHRYGVVRPNQKHFNFDIADEEMPICVYGSLQLKNDSGVQTSQLEMLGFEIIMDPSMMDKSQNDV